MKSAVSARSDSIENSGFKKFDETKVETPTEQLGNRPPIASSFLLTNNRSLRILD